MTLPSPIQTGAITGHFIDPLGRPLRGTVILSYDRQVLLAPDASPPTTIIARTKAFDLDSEGDLLAEGIILSDSPGLRRQGFTVKAVFALSDEDGQKRPRGIVHFQLTQAQPTKDLTTVSNDEPDGGYPVFPEFRQVPAGGNTGQLLAKASDADGDTTWVNGGSGGAYPPVSGIPKSDLSAPVRASLDKADSALQSVPSIYITDDELAEALANQLASIRQVPAGGTDGQVLTKVSGTPAWATPSGGGGGGYPPAGGVPKSDLAAPVQASLGLADSATQGGYVKPAPGIPGTDLTSQIRASLGLADTALQLSALTPYATTASVTSAIGAITPASIGAATSADLDNVFGIATAAIPASQKAAANGVATLDGSGLLPVSQLPPIAVVDYLGAVANQAAMLAKVGQKGDWVTRTDRGTTWVIIGSDPTQLASWQELSYPTAPVTSVAGRTGSVTLAKADVGLDQVDNTSDLNKPLSTAATTALSGKAATVHTHVAADITDASTVGKAVLTAADATAARGAIGAGTSSLAVGTTSTTAKRGDYTPSYADLPVGVPRCVYKSGGTWPARPDTDTTHPVIWIGADPSPAIVTSGTAGMYNGDARWVTA